MKKLFILVLFLCIPHIVIGATKYEYYNTGYTTDNYIYGDTHLIGQTFKPQTSHKITSIKVYIKKTGSPGASEWCIRPTSGGKPSGNSIASGSLAADSIGASYGWVEVSLGTGGNLIGGTLYSITGYAPFGDTNNWISWGSDASSPTYNNGTLVTSDGSTWTIDDTADALFEEWGDPVIPLVTTQAATNVLKTTATGHGTITDIGGANCTRRGFCYKVGTSGDPTTANSVAYDDGTFGTGAYTKAITGLTAGTGYRVRAYAVNSAGTGYGTTVQITTLSNPNISTHFKNKDGTIVRANKDGLPVKIWGH